MDISENKIQDLIDVIRDLLEALEAPTPESCDCGGSSLCAVCKAHRILKEIAEADN